MCSNKWLAIMGLLYNSYYKIEKKKKNEKIENPVEMINITGQNVDMLVIVKSLWACSHLP